MVLLWTDTLFFLIVTALLLWVLRARKIPRWQQVWQQLIQKPSTTAVLIIALSYLGVGLADSIHLQQHNSQVMSLLDKAMSPLHIPQEKSYSRPFALTLEDGNLIHEYGQTHWVKPRLHFPPQHIGPHNQFNDIKALLRQALVKSVLMITFLTLILIIFLAYREKNAIPQTAQRLFSGQFPASYRTILITLFLITILGMSSVQLSQHYHILGTNQVGGDVFYQVLKSIRTGLMIGTLTTLLMLPFALMLGTCAGYFGGWIDDIVQYIYSTLNAIPSVLLITAGVLALQVFINTHESSFPTLLARADARLLALCGILGLTSWTSLCRLLRAETLKLRQLEFVEAAKALGVGPLTIIKRHIVPNLMPIILITLVLDFSALVLMEAVLSYVGVGVDPTTFSWGNLINSARLELAREPLVWWPLMGAFVSMMGLVLSMNLFADALQKALNPEQT